MSAPVDESENAVTIPEIAILLRVSTAKVYRMANAGEIPAFRVGRSWRFFPSKVRAHLEAPKDRWAQSARSLGRKRRPT
ncbi:helix-turn-helix domain-containing protein [Microbacterium sp. VKM Ac-2923]|uniref:helix-turn-helix domain-containing protein n=1 Tax=Microbacterium sp. VKM Ac-2923 TaxID=2929476 RepID=UPI001FB4CD76|nr:helix-turn-helix domain-containing protein [Microbacterium sp. VKM Ac-2923]MCJ1709290.1 helix-turn-helix domain-containing protein [Microbacterium sp. VKM Ac-2923]